MTSSRLIDELSATLGLVPDPSGVYRLPGHADFAYTEGASAERYLERALSSGAALDSDSAELEPWIVDWSSRYHLSVKRANLLRGFDFDPGLRTLEVGCGCGAITRLLGERLDEVIAVEGSPTRARLAQLRTADLPSVSVVCAPFQAIEAEGCFDLIVCVGVFEYSAAFVDAPDPYAAVLERFEGLLAPGGRLLIAIENRFGAKYLNGAPEDHVARPYEGVEGYPRDGARVRTFGRDELERRLALHFPRLRFFHPYPDYKLPDCVLTDELAADPRAAELVAGICSADYSDDGFRSWNECLVTLGLAAEGLLPRLSNSFLVCASGADGTLPFEPLGVKFAVERRPQFRTLTRIERTDEGGLRAIKSRMGAGPTRWARLAHAGGTSAWQEGRSVATRVRERCMGLAPLETLFEPAGPWLRALRGTAFDENGVAMVDGAFVDAIWSNAYVRDDGGCTFIDTEWRWTEPVALHALLLRAAVVFLQETSADRRPGAALRVASGRRACERIGQALGVTLTDADFRRFVELQVAFNVAATGVSERGTRSSLRLFMLNRRAADPRWGPRRRLDRIRRGVRRVTTRRPAGSGARPDRRVGDHDA